MTSPVAGLPDHSGERFLRQAELAEQMGVSPRTVRAWTAAGMPHDLWGRRMPRYQLSRCVAWVRARSSERQAA